MEWGSLASSYCAGDLYLVLTQTYVYSAIWKFTTKSGLEILLFVRNVLTAQINP